ncbi:hypothetical protein GN316_05225 [Xylophilus sp. Kf1]|nr:hypothetical protein [Xylophilus sp. Kf1]
MRALRSLGLSVVMAAALAPAGAAAHGDWPARHGGVMNDGGETSFELVREKSAIVAHVSDHGEPLEVQGAKPELQIRRGATLEIVKGIPQGTRIVFPGALVRGGDELNLKLTFANGSVAFGRFPPPAVASLATRASAK